MIRLLTAGVRIAFFAAAMAAAVPMIAFAQTTEPAVGSAPAPAKPALAAAGEDDTQRRFNKLRRELLNDRADTIDWWLVLITIVLGFLALVSVVLGYVGFRRFQKIEAEAKDSVEARDQTCGRC